MKNILLTFVFLLFGLYALPTDIYQWSVPLREYISPETKIHPDAFLWIPENCQRVRAVIVSQQNMCEETIFNHSIFRETLSDLDFAMIWIAPALNYQWDVTTGCQDVFDNMLSDLADLSGYSEIKHVPIVPLGHSAMATFPWNFAAWNAQKTLAIISYKGDAPRTNLTGYGGANLEWGRTRNIDGIPGLMIEGEYEWWEARVNPALAFRMMYPQSCVSFLYDRGQGHFDASDKVIEYLCLFLKKAAQYRLPEHQSPTLEAQLMALKTEDGWLLERWKANNKKRPKPASYNSYKGNEHDAFWYFDQEMAEATERYYQEVPHKQMRYIAYQSQGSLLSFKKDTHAQYTFSPELDSNVCFNITALLTDSSHVNRIPEFSKYNKDINISKINGPVTQINDTTFKLDFYRIGLSNPRRSGDIWLMAQIEENKSWKSAVQQLNIQIPYPLIEGERQYVLFPGITDVAVGAKSIKMQAVSDKGLKVSYYVKHGPAKVEDDKLIFTPIPPRSKFPVEIKVIAWQYGQKGEIQSAQAVERNFYITE